MTVDEFLLWWDQQPDDKRYELVNGQVVGMSPETIGHNRRKLAAYDALRHAIDRAGVHFWTFTDGMTVRIDEYSAYEPDAMAACDEDISDDTILIRKPVIVVEVLSPGTRQVDHTLKLTGYFALDSVHHYLIIDANRPSIVHHCRNNHGTIDTRIVTNGTIKLDPPGIEIDIDTIYA